MASFSIRVILVELGALLQRKEVISFQNVFLSDISFIVILEWRFLFLTSQGLF